MRKNIIKSISLVFLFFAMLNLNINAQAQDYLNYCSAKSLEKDFKGNLASLTGTNFLARKLAAKGIAKALKKETKADFKVRIDNFYGVSLTSGIFKSLSIEGNNFLYDGMLISNLNAKTLCPYNHIQYKEDKLTYVENLVLDYKLEITQEDLNKNIQSEKFKQMFNKINNDKYLSSLFRIENPKIKLSEDKLSLNYRIIPLPKNKEPLPFFDNLIKPFDINLTTGLRVEDNRISLCNLDVNSKKVDYSYFLPLINFFNPTSSKIKLDKYNEADLRIDNVKIKSSKILIQGAIITLGVNNKIGAINSN